MSHRRRRYATPCEQVARHLGWVSRTSALKCWHPQEVDARRLGDDGGALVPAFPPQGSAREWGALLTPPQDSAREWEEEAAAEAAAGGGERSAEQLAEHALDVE